MSVQKKKMNAEIEVLRFLMILGVMILHFSEDYIDERGIVWGGHLGVDFFFVLSGFFLYKHYMKKKGEADVAWLAAIKYTLHKIKTLYPHFIMAAVLINATNYFVKRWDILDLLKHIWDIKWEFMFLHYLGANVPFDLRSIWFLSSLIFNCYLIYLLLESNEDVYLGIIPISAIIVNVIFYRELEHLGTQALYIGFFNGGILRGFVEMSLGVLVAALLLRTDIKEKIIENRKISILIKIVLLVIMSILVIRLGFSKEDYFLLPVVFAWLILVECVPFKIFENPFVYKVSVFMGRLSYPMFLYHLICSKWLCVYLPNKNYYKALVLYVAITVTLSGGIDFIFNIIKNKKRGQKVEK